MNFNRHTLPPSPPHRQCLPVQPLAKGMLYEEEEAPRGIVAETGGSRNRIQYQGIRLHRAGFLPLFHGTNK